MHCCLTKTAIVLSYGHVWGYKLGTAKMVWPEQDNGSGLIGVAVVDWGIKSLQ